MGVLDRLRGVSGERTPAAKAIVAAAMPMSGPGVTRVNRGRSHTTTEQWQQEAWYYFDAIGELRGPFGWIANAVSQADIHATELDPETGKPTGPTDDTQAQAVAAMALGGAAQRSGLLRLLALCWQVPGEAWIIVRPAKRAGDPDVWLVLSGNKVKAKGESWQYTDPYTAELVTLDSRDRLLRIWCPHPNDQAKADSSARPALPICREIEKASQSIAARLDSRLAMNGVWMVPEEIDFPKGDHESVGAAIMDLFLSVAETSIQNPGQAAATVPIVLTVPGEQISQAVWQDFASAFDAAVVELRQDALRRLAATLDMPKDVAEGTQGESNHWSAWQVEESTYKIYIEPLLKAIGDAITELWFRPALVAMGRTPEQAAAFELGWDTTAIVARPDDTENLRDLHDRLLISDAYMLSENGVPEDAAPDEEEYTKRLLERIVVGAPTLLSDPNVAAAMGLEIVVSPAASGATGNVQGGELVAPEPTSQNALPGTQGQEPQPAGVPGGLVAAAEVLVMQALDRAGGRLLTNQNRGQFKSTPRHELYQHIRPENAAALVEIKFTEELARSFAVRPGALRVALEMYVTKILTTGEAYDREEMRWYIR